MDEALSLRTVAVMPGLAPGIHVFTAQQQARRGWPGQARPWRKRVPHCATCASRRSG